MTLEILQNPAIPEVELDFVGSIAAPFYWVLRNAEGKDRLRNGTVFFINTGTSIVAATACHVIDQCMEDAKTREFVQCMIGGVGETLYFKIEDRLIDRNPKMDLATLQVTQQEVAELGCSILSGLQPHWPPPLAQPEHAVILCGFPGKSRSEIGPSEHMFGRVAIGTNVSNSRDAKISLLVEREGMYRCLGEGVLPENYNFGGISGGPLVALAERAGIRAWTAAGVIVNGPNPGDDPSQQFISGMEVFYATPIHFIKADGHLDIDLWNNSNP